MIHNIHVILACMLLGCNATKPTKISPEAEVEQLFAGLIYAFEKGDEEKAASYFVFPLTHDLSPEDAQMTRNLFLDETKRIGEKIRVLPDGGNMRGSKVLGNFAAILIEARPEGSLQPIYLHRTPAGWKFLSELSMFSNYLFEFELSESVSDIEDNKKINTWIERQIEESETNAD